jgi:hypothetical protein
MKGVKKMAKWIMPGTEGTKEYMTVARTALGVVGVREYAPGAYRVRVEPTEAGVAAIASKLTADAGWKQPGEGGQNRFSHTVNAPEGAKDEALVAMVKTALFAILAGGNEPEVNSRARAWAKKLVSKDALVAEVKHRKVQGANLASSWSLKALCSKVSA